MVQSKAKVEVYSGSEIFPTYPELSPIVQVETAKSLIDRAKETNTLISINTNAADLVGGIRYIGEKEGVDTEFFLNGISQGNSIEPIFAFFNEAIELVNKYGI